MGKLGKNLIIKQQINLDIQRKVVAHKTMESWDTIPHVCVQYEPDITQFFEEYNRIKKRYNEKMPDGVKISVNSILLKAIAESVKEAPEMNSIFSYKKNSRTGTLYVSEDINIAIPFIYTGDKDITPTIPQCGKKTIVEIAQTQKDLARRLKNTNVNQLLRDVGKGNQLNDLSRAKLSVIPSLFKAFFGKHKVSKLKGKEKKEYYSIPESERLVPNDLLSASILVSNIGSVYRDFKGNISLLEIIPPQVVVIGLSSIQEKPGIVNNSDGTKTIEPRLFLPMNIAFDHRPLDYAHIVPFLKNMDKIFSNPEEFFTTHLGLN